MKRLLVQTLWEHVDQTGIRDMDGFLIFLDIVFVGFIHLFQRYLRNELPLSPNAIAWHTYRVYIAGLPSYR